MKQASSLPIMGKKMTKEAMKALKGGRLSSDCLDSGYVCNGCCYASRLECRSACGALCPLAICIFNG